MDVLLRSEEEGRKGVPRSLETFHVKLSFPNFGKLPRGNGSPTSGIGNRDNDRDRGRTDRST